MRESRHFPFHRTLFFHLIASCQPDDRMHRALRRARLRITRNSRVARSRHQIAAKIDERRGARVIVSRVASRSIETSVGDVYARTLTRAAPFTLLYLSTAE